MFCTRLRLEASVWLAVRPKVVLGVGLSRSRPAKALAAQHWVVRPVRPGPIECVTLPSPCTHKHTGEAGAAQLKSTVGQRDFLLCEVLYRYTLPNSSYPERFKLWMTSVSPSPYRAISATRPCDRDYRE